jgi:hypothetical protein
MPEITVKSLLRQNPTEFKIRSGQNVTAMGWPKSQRVKIINTVTNHPFLEGVDE